MADRLLNTTSMPVKLVDNKDGSYSVATSLSGRNLVVDSSGNVLQDQAKEYRILSTSPKPASNIPYLSTLSEIDTGNNFYWNGTTWVVM
jgi:hypothetical protein